ncbi:MAG: acyltransferase [Chloroherpetonaceae bacterium]|nr:acyltransferase [Chloroherpetonaceae bacterium]
MRKRGLDFLRSIAILLVLIVHSSEVFRNYGFSLQGKWNLGNMGVMLFFVLSGYLIGGILINELEEKTNYITVLKFWLKRWFRTLPNYYLFLLINIFIIWKFKSSSYNELFDMWKFAFFIQNILSTFQKSIFPESWSLAVEEWMYLILPILVFIIIRVFRVSIKNSILIACCFIFLFSISFGLYFTFINPDYSKLHFSRGVIFHTFSNFYSIAIGVFAAYLNFYHSKVIEKYHLNLFRTGLAILFFYFPLFYLFSKYFILLQYSVVLSFFLMIFYFALSDLSWIGDGKVWFVIKWTSLLSYSIYLNQNIVIFFINRIKFYQNPFYILSISKIIIIWGFCYGLAFLTYKYVELPFIEFRKLIINKIK